MRSPGLPASATEAVNDVVAATGHLLDHCRPSTSGVAVVGRIDPPSGDAPPLQARCSIDLQKRRGFYDAQVLVVTPPDLQGVHVDCRTRPSPARMSETEHAGDRVGVRRDAGRRDVGLLGRLRDDPTRRRHGSGLALDKLGAGDGGDNRCGFSGGGSGNANGPEVSFVSACGS